MSNPAIPEVRYRSWLVRGLHSQCPALNFQGRPKADLPAAVPLSPVVAGPGDTDIDGGPYDNVDGDGSLDRVRDLPT